MGRCKGSSRTGSKLGLWPASASARCPRSSSTERSRSWQRRARATCAAFRARAWAPPHEGQARVNLKGKLSTLGTPLPPRGEPPPSTLTTLELLRQRMAEILAPHRSYHVAEARPPEPVWEQR